MVKRGEIYWVDWDPGRGSEQTGIRPALIVQNDVGNDYSPSTIVAALTTAPMKPYPFAVPVTAKESGLPKDSVINLSSILTIDKERLMERCGSLPTGRMTQVDFALKKSLGLK
ncbi:MAG: type II toxin-antitoxin system PemK/MazF family toxin [Dehalococcoidia bacterium]|nr:type II toxin-antitoxin system PemK/MazF family toxin [Dehalococcoidia bacterium]